MASELKDIKVIETVHLWHCVNNIFKSLTNEPLLYIIEHLSNFDKQEAFTVIANERGFICNNEFNFPDGFLVIDHHMKRGRFIVSEGWTKEVEEELRRLKYIK